MCENCDYRTNVKGNLTLHLRNVHGQSVTNEKQQLVKISTEGAPTEPNNGGKQHTHISHGACDSQLAIRQEAAISSALQQVTAVGAVSLSSSAFSSNAHESTGIYSGIQHLTDVDSNVQLEYGVKSDIQDRTIVTSTVPPASVILGATSNVQHAYGINSDIQDRTIVTSLVPPASGIPSNIQHINDLSHIQPPTRMQSNTCIHQMTTMNQSNQPSDTTSPIQREQINSGADRIPCVPFSDAPGTPVPSAPIYGGFSPDMVNIPTHCLPPR